MACQQVCCAGSRAQIQNCCTKTDHKLTLCMSEWASQQVYTVMNVCMCGCACACVCVHPTTTPPGISCARSQIGSPSRPLVAMTAGLPSAPRRRFPWPWHPAATHPKAVGHQPGQPIPCDSLLDLETGPRLLASCTGYCQGPALCPVSAR